MPAGWDLTGLACDDSDRDSTVSLADAAATFAAAPGETVTCTFTNTKRGSIVVKKKTLPAGDTTPFTFTGDAAGTIAATAARSSSPTSRRARTPRPSRPGRLGPHRR